MSTAHFITISHIFQPEIKMYHAYAIDTQTNTFYVGVIAAERTYTLHRWMTTEFQHDNDLIITGVPVLAISAAAAQTRDHMDGSWRLGSLHATARVTEGWSWNSFTSSLMPPVSQAYPVLSVTALRRLHFFGPNRPPTESEDAFVCPAAEHP